jgi:hypothetical protein
MEETTVAARSVSYLELHLESYSGSRLRTKLYDKRNDFHIPIVNFPSIRSNIPAATAYGVSYLSVEAIFQTLWFLSIIMISLIENYC